MFQLSKQRKVCIIARSELIVFQESKGVNITVYLIQSAFLQVYKQKKKKIVQQSES